VLVAPFSFLIWAFHDSVVVFLLTSHLESFIGPESGCNVLIVYRIVAGFSVLSAYHDFVVVFLLTSDLESFIGPVSRANGGGFIRVGAFILGVVTFVRVVTVISIRIPLALFAFLVVALEN
jgi:hypothetical protein